MVNCLWLLRRALGIHTKNKFLISRAHVEMKIKTCAYKKNNMKKVYKTTQIQLSVSSFNLRKSQRDAHVKFLNCKNCMRKKERENGTRIIHWMACVVYPQKAFRYQLIVNYKRGNNPKKTSIDCLAWCIFIALSLDFFTCLYIFNRWDFCPTSQYFNMKLSTQLTCSPTKSNFSHKHRIIIIAVEPSSLNYWWGNKKLNQFTHH